ncbi:EH signature domain-containing protein [Limnohabitans sp. DM1]|uniref:EH signature domain-containing protein n=1 Tax=Limnohabitans sp. DM1 TaxID=1597955 RepID=UPI000B059973|nr:EH signature domain-containing protein [Limnohabitans sp. DM1]
MDLLNLLSNLLSDSVRNTPISMSRNTDIDDVLDGLKQRARQGTSNHVPYDLQVEAVKKFWDTGEFKTFREARLVSFSLAVRPWNDRRCLIEEPARFSSVLTELGHWETSPRQFRKCYQGLMHSYFHYYGAYKLDLDGNAVSMTGQKNWGALRTYLNEKANHVQDATINPDWVGCLLENKGIFSATPCDAYADDVLNGRNGKVLQIREHLGITNASWFTRSLVLTQIEKVCKQRDMLFLSKVDQLMTLLGDNKVLRDLGLQLILNRYAQTQVRLPHPKLKEACITAWDIPWSAKDDPWLLSVDTRWAGVSHDAREMIGDWLKEECIELFFTKLVKDAQDSSQGGEHEKFASTCLLEELDTTDQKSPICARFTCTRS